MKSTILTKVNKTQVMFKELINIVKTEGDNNFLTQFVLLCHPAHKRISHLPDGRIEVETKKTYYTYTAYATHIKRVDGIKNTTVWYKIC